MVVYVLNKEGKALMPTTPRKARLLLKKVKAKVIRVKPFTIQLPFGSSGYKQDIILGVDSGYLNVGFSATTEKKELIVGEIKLLQGIKQRLFDRAIYRGIRRSRLRHRKMRWSNRTKSKPKGWLAPSLQHKLDSHIRFIDSLYKMLPITKCIVEVANFDIQKMKDDTIRGASYQQGDMMGFWNAREYVLHRDNHKCQNPNCKNKVKEQILQIHHIKFRNEGGSDVPSNLITLCTKCHTSPNHKQGKFLYDWCMEGKKVKQFKAATFMSMVRWYLINELKKNHNNIYSTYGYITKNHRIENGIEKTHYNDAFAITKGINQIRNTEILVINQSKRNNRSLEKFYDAKYIDIRTGEKVSGKDLDNGRRTRNKNLNSENLHQYRGQKLSKGQRRIRTKRYFYQPNDLVKYEDEIFTVKGTQNNGAYVALKEIKKVPRVELLKSYKFQRGFVYGLC